MSRCIQFSIADSILSGRRCLLATAATAAATPCFTKNPADASHFREVILSWACRCDWVSGEGLWRSSLRRNSVLIFNPGWGFSDSLFVQGFRSWAILIGGQLLALAWITLLSSLPVIALQIWFARREAPWARIDGSSLEPTQS